MFDKFFKRFELISSDNQSEDTLKNTEIWQEPGYILSKRELEIEGCYTEYNDFINFTNLPKNKNKFQTTDSKYHYFMGDVTNLHKFIKNYLCDWEVLKDYKHLYFADTSYMSICKNPSDFFLLYKFSIQNVKIEEELDIVQTLHNNGKFKYLYDLDEIQDYDSYEDYMTNEFFNWLMSKSYINIIMDELKNKYECEEDRCKKLDQICDTILNLFNANENLNSLNTIAFLLR